MKFQMILRSVILLVAVSMLGGCAVLQWEKYYEPYESGALQGEGVRIEAEDGSFVLKEGRFTPPFQTFHASDANSIFFAAFTNGSPPPGVPLINSYDLALRQGAKKVRVFHPAANEPLYGVLALNKRMFKFATGASARSYLIRIPDSYVNEATGGGVSVVYEPVSWKGQPKGEIIGWALWMSDSPF
jgi:hypothetical protein